MAVNYLLLLITAILSLSIPSTLSRNTLPSTHATTATLDVSHAIQQTLNVLNFKPTGQSHDEQSLSISTTTIPSSSSSSSFSVSLHPRSSLTKPIHKDYKSLTLSRLHRDSARVDSLNEKLHFALSGFNRSELKPVDDVVFQPEELATPISSGFSQGSGEYFARLGVGQPAKEFYMAIDTGSDVTWLQCDPCTDCYQQTDPIFNPSGSSSYTPLPCSSQQCSDLDVSACRDNTCLYQVSYGDGSFTVGDLATDTLSFGNSGSIPKVAIGCGHDNEGLFTGSAGLAALGGGPLGLPSQLKANSFSYCLVSRDATSSSTLEFNSAAPTNSVVAPLLRNSRVKTFFYVGLTGISVGGNQLGIPPSVFAVDETGHGGIIVDSGTAVTRLQTTAYEALRDAFVQGTQQLPKSSSFALFDTCYDLSALTTIAVPTVAFTFAGGKTLPLKPKNYLIPVDSSGKFCLAFAPTQGSLSIIGNIQQQGTRVSYDLANSHVGFTPNNC